ncbi:DUF2997 domain-containing protein [Blastopirellula sp. JC732]|uniref:DUF2997 domain-containing protein n=1 Tax=Blastopirellula sediminis TaxID=2894196 RepID=A0A9X1SFS6_9BACT|nr:DUF2997 domain-containing protein [Blastopirellula sediminis]MCC9608560.1 DUF2997 domain-containing protein [Blastopirellula sediminis]MCC9628663.1 DUF2997 domain-containing protein [Blastopirellula sediminis]
MSKTIEIIVAPDGGTRVETKGFTGADCRQASQFVESALGQRTGEELTGAFYQQTESEQVRQQNY